MTQTRRIVLNVAATYGRSLYALVIGLFTARWVLMSLGEVDYGLIGVIGVLAGFMMFFNTLLSTAVARFYAFAVGEAQVASDGAGATENCRRWFNVALQMHLAVAAASLLIGYPAGEWAIRGFLTIPPERIGDCVWAFRFSCLACAATMLTVPCNAMFAAKQEIAELTVYGVAGTTCNALFLWHMVTHEGDWFLRYSAWTAMLAAAPSVLIAVRAFAKYKECRIVRAYWNDWGRIKEMFAYASCNFIQMLAVMSAYQGISILVNKMKGPAANASMTIAQSVQSHGMTLSGSLRGAMAPAITNASGAGDFKRVESLACKASTYASLAVAVFAVPLAIEIDEVMRLWLKTPPAHSGNLAVLLLAAGFVDLLTIGQTLAVLARKEIRNIQLFQTVAFALPIIFTFAAFRLGWSIEAVGVGFLLLYSFNNVGKLHFARRQCRISLRNWMRKVLIPVLSTVAAAVVAGCLPTLVMRESFARLLATVAFAEAAFLPMVWFAVLDGDERRMVRARIASALRIGGGCR